MDLKIQSLIILLIIFIKILLIPGISSIRNEPLDIEQMNTINKFQMIFLLFYLLFLPLIAYNDSKKMPLILLLMVSIIVYIAMIMMIIFKSKKTETIYCKAFCKDKTKNKKELVTFFEGLDPTNTASAFLLIFYLAECLYLMMFGAIPFIDMNKDVNLNTIMFLACLACALIVTSMVLHSTDINLGTMCKKKCVEKGMYSKNGVCSK